MLFTEEQMSISQLRNIIRDAKCCVVCPDDAGCSGHRKKDIEEALFVCKIPRGSLTMLLTYILDPESESSISFALLPSNTGVEVESDPSASHFLDESSGGERVLIKPLLKRNFPTTATEQQVGSTESRGVKNFKRFRKVSFRGFNLNILY